MKKIMKKALSLALAVVMMLTLAPMTAKAADGDLAMNSPKSFTFDGLNDIKYTYAAEETGKLKIEWGSFDWQCQIWEGTTIGLGGNQVANGYGADKTDNTNFIEAPVEAGKSYTVVIRLSEAGNGMYMATFSAGQNGPAIEGDGSYYAPYDVTNAMDALPQVGHMQTVYYAISGLEGGAKYNLTILDSVSRSQFLLSDMNGNSASATGMGPSGTGATLEVTANGRGMIMFTIASQYGVCGGFKATVEAVDAKNPLGHDENPDTLVIAANDEEFTPVELTSDLTVYNYTYKATKEGKLVLTVMGNKQAQTGYMFAIMGGSNIGEESQSVYVESTQEDPIVNPATYYVKAGDEITIKFATAAYGAGTVAYNAVFTECAFPTVTVSKFTPVTDDNLQMSKNPLAVGENTVDVSKEEVTLYEFAAETGGVYSFTVETGCVGLWGTAGTLATTGTLTNPNSTVKTIEVTVKENETVIIGLTGVEEGTSAIKVAKVKDVVEGPTSTVYEDAWFFGTSPEPYTFTGDVEELEFIDIEDEVNDFIENVYPASDGFYHFGSKTGPVILVDLDGLYDWINPLVSAENKALKGGDEDKDGKALNYSNLYKFYVAIADKETKLYPLNDDLIDIYMDAGKAQGWYTESVGGITTADGWMFNCCYVPAPVDNSGETEKEPVKVEVPADKVIAESALGTAIQEAVANNTPLVVETTTEGVTLTFAPADLKDAEAVKLNVEVKLDVDVKDETVAKNDDITADNFVLKVEFSHDGKLPAKATITIPVPAKFANKTLFYYEILADGTLKFVCDAPVDADGNAKVTQDHCSDYVLLTEKVAEAPKTGDNTNFALWIAVLGLGVVAIAGSVVMKKREF